MSNPTLEDQCNGTTFNDNQFNEWFTLWNSGVCPTLYEDILFTRTDGGRGYNAAELSRIQTDLTAAFNTYTQKFGYTITSDLSSPNFNDWQVLLHQTCQLLPGGCAGFLTDYCATLDRTQIATDPTFLAFCGCYSEVNNLGVDTVCATLCTKQRVIKFPDNRGGNAECDKAVCVIDQINLAATKSSVGSININQVCTNCPDEGCRCVIDVSQLAEIEQALGTVQINQFCGSDSGCFQFDPSTGNPVTKVNCSTAGGNVPTPNFGNQISTATWIGIGIVFAIAIILIVILLIIYATR